MKVIDFIEEVRDETEGTGGLADSLPVVVKLKDGTCLQVASVELFHTGLVIKIESW